MAKKTSRKVASVGAGIGKSEAEDAKIDYNLNNNDKLWKVEAAIVIFSIAAFGLFYECFSSIATVAIGIVLIMRIGRTGRIHLPSTLLGWVILLLPVLMLITVPYAIDSGMAAMGVIKFLPVALFILLIQTESGENREKVLGIIPDAAALITLVTMLAWFTPLKDTFYINDRYSGTFQYANAYAAFLMVCIFLITFRAAASRKEKVKSCVEAVILMSGILLTGCRAVFFLLVMGLVFQAIWALCKKKKQGLYVLLAIVAVVVIGLVIAVCTGEMYSFARYTQINLRSSSLMARLLYNIDGFKMLLDHPFGMGAKGFLFYQGSVQTGNYSATYAHNELLQMGLDVGIIPAVFAGVAYLQLVVSRATSLRNRIILLTLGIHVLFDWDFQFPVMLMILALLISGDGGKVIAVSKARKWIAAAAITLCVVASLWLGTASALELLQKYETAAKVFPGLTTSQMRVVSQTSDSNEKYAAAMQICKQNDYCTIALQCMAEKFAQNGDFDSMAAYAKKAMKSARYNKEGYEIYIYLMSYAVEASNANGNAEDTYKYLQDVLEARNQIYRVKEETSVYAKYLYDKPDIELDEEYMTYLEQASEIVQAQ